MEFSRIENVVFGEAAYKVVPEQVDAWGASRVLVLASRTLNSNSGAVQEIAEALGDRCLGIEDGVGEHTPLSAVMALTAKAERLNADAFVTVGGGTLTDAAKAVRMCLANDARSPQDLPSGEAPGGSAPKAPQVKQISVPTTLSAAEYTGIAGVTNDDTHVKSLWRQAEIAPTAVVLDPDITRHTPDWLFLSTGLRAIDHAVEGFCALEANDYTDAQAAQGLSLLVKGLSAVAHDREDLDARLDCQLGAWMAMCPLACGVPMGASHGIGYVLGAGYAVPHGYTSCVMLPAVLEWNAETNRHRQDELATRAGLDTPLSSVIRELVNRLGLPTNLDAIGVAADQDESVAVRSLDTPWVPRNPRAIVQPAQVREILKLAR